MPRTTILPPVVAVRVHDTLQDINAGVETRTVFRVQKVDELDYLFKKFMGKVLILESEAGFRFRTKESAKAYLRLAGSYPADSDDLIVGCRYFVSAPSGTKGIQPPENLDVLLRPGECLIYTGPANGYLYSFRVEREPPEVYLDAQGVSDLAIAKDQGG